MSKRTRVLVLSLVTAIATGMTTAFLDWASARWLPVPTVAEMEEVPMASGPVEAGMLDEPDVAAGPPQVEERRGRVLGLKWAQRPVQEVDTDAVRAAEAGPVDQ
jgi:hypothetical protein